MLLGCDASTRRAALVGLALRHGDAILVGLEDAPLFAGDARADLDFVLRARGIGRSERRRHVDEIAALLGLDRVATNRAGTDGAARAERARLVVGRAVLTGRSLLILDAFPGRLERGDARALVSTLRVLARMRGVAIVLGTADREAALEAGARVGVMEGTRIVQFGDARSLFARPRSAGVASLLFEANLLSGRIEPGLEEAPECRVRLATGETMPAAMADALEAGDLCRLAVRQDQIAFAAIDAAAMGGDALAATLTDHADFGDHLRLRFRLSDGSAVLVRRPAGSVGAAALDRAREPGGASLAWRTGHAIAFAWEADG